MVDGLRLRRVLLEMVFYVTEPAFDSQGSSDKLHRRDEFIRGYPLENTYVLVDLLGKLGVVGGDRRAGLSLLRSRRNGEN